MRRLTLSLLILASASLLSTCAGTDGDVDDILDPSLNGISRETAIARAQAEVVQPLAADRFVLALAWEAMLPAGTEISEIGPDDGDGPLLTLDADAYFIFVDPVPTHKYGHPVTYLLVDATSGEITQQPAWFPPSIDGVDVYVTLRERLASSDRFEPATDTELLKPVVPITVVFPDETVSAVAAQPTSALFADLSSNTIAAGPGGRMVGVTVASGSDIEIKNDAKNVAKQLRSMGFTVTEFDSAKHDLTTVVDGIRIAAAGLKPEDKFMLYISSHMEIEDDDDDGKPDSRPSRLTYGLGEDNETTWTLFSTTHPFSLPAILDDITAGLINVVLDACYAEQLSLYLTRPVRGDFEPKPGVTVNVFAASAADKTAGGGALSLAGIPVEAIADWLGILDAGSVYTEQFVDHLEKASLDFDNDGKIDPQEAEVGFKAAHASLVQSLAGSQAPPPVKSFFAGSLPTGLKLRGLATAYFDSSEDPPPLGDHHPPPTGGHPWLFAIGTDGAVFYAIETDASGVIIAARPSLKRDASIVGEGIVPVSAGEGTGLTRAIFVFGSGGVARSHWAGTNWGGFAIYRFGDKDVVSYGGNSRSPGVSWGTAVFHEYDASSNFFNGDGSLVHQFPSNPIPIGSPVTTFVDEATRGIIVVNDGSPGQIWYHSDRSNEDLKATLVGVAGNDPRQVRAKNGLVAISNYASGTITLMTWNGSSPPAFARISTFGTTPLEIDMAVLDNGNTALAVASATTNRWWLGELDGSGNQVNEWSGSAPCTGGLADVVFIPGVKTYLAIGCQDDGVITFIETEVTAPIESQ